MAFLNEVGGKINSRTLLIGDGVDKVHSPLQVLPQMATDMLNLTSNKYPSLSVRNGRTSLMSNLLALDGLGASAYYLATIKPFVDSRGNIHYAVEYVNESTTPDKIYLVWYVLYPGYTVPEKLITITIQESYYLNPSTLPTEKYANMNFTEYNGYVYLFHKYTDGGVNKIGYTLYSVAGRTAGTSAGATSTTAERVSPSCVYVDKMYMSDGLKLFWSATGSGTDFTTAANSGSVSLSQGGKITSLVPMRDRLFVSTERALFLVFGNSFDTISVSLLADNIGISTPKCITQKNGVVYFGASDGDVYEYSGGALVNITREPIDTGSRSGVKGGFLQSEFVITSIAIEDNALYCVDDRRIVNTTKKNIYVFDLTKRRWYQQDYPYTVSSMLAIWDTMFDGATNAYHLLINHYFVESQQQIYQTLYSANNGTSYTSQYTVDVAGAKQKMKNTIVGTITTAGYFNVNATWKFDPLTTFGVSGTMFQTLALNDTPAQSAAKMAAYLNTKETLNTTFVFSSVGADLFIETLYYVGDILLTFTISNGGCAGLTTTTIAAVTTGVLNTYKTTSVQSAAPFKWVSPAYQLTPTGKQMLKAIHFSYYSPQGTGLSVYTSNTIDQEDFIKIRTLPNSAFNQSGKFVLPVNRNGKNDWLRIKLSGTGNVTVYNMTMDWRILEKVR